MLSMTECCKRVMQYCNDGYARAYANAWLRGHATDAQSQAAYVLSNIGYWRGDDAKVVRQSLKAIATCKSR